MPDYDSTAEKRIAHETPRPTLTCEFCGESSTSVRRYGQGGTDVPAHTACPGCSYNPVTDDLDAFREALE